MVAGNFGGGAGPLDRLTGIDMSNPPKRSREKKFSVKSELGEIFLAEGD